MEAALVILDGWGIAHHDRRNAIEAAETPVVDALTDRGAAGTLDPTGRRVGLPAGEAGNSEVGHLHLGAGRVVDQAYTRINDSIEDGSFRQNEALTGAFDHVDATGGRVHFVGLLSAGGVHADHRHLHALIEWAGDRDLEASSHVFTDGRDMDPHSGIELARELATVVDRVGTGGVATVCGRYFGMDRDENWERTRRAYDAIVDRRAPHEAGSAVEAIEAAYERGESDEFIEPTVVDGQEGVSADDAIVLINFRGDRARQLVRMLVDIEPTWSFETDPPSVHVVTMTEYDRTFDLPVAFPPPVIDLPLGAVLARHGLTQLRIAESEKYAHVTYFLNGGREIEFEGELRRIVPSPDVATYDRRPEMSAVEVTDTALEVIAAEDPDVLVLNYANPDMVGHTGDYEAAIEAVATVDRELGRLLAFLGEAEAHVLVTADHGNADDMGTPERPHTAHTANPVPFLYRAPSGGDGGMRVREGGSLVDVAPTLLGLLDIDPPAVMTGRSLLIPAEDR